MAWHLVAVLQQESGSGQLVNSVEVKSTGRGVVWGLWDFLQTLNETKDQTFFSKLIKFLILMNI